MSKKKKCPECPKGPAKWMVTFSDMTTLLLVFFVLLLSMANFDKEKIEQVFGVLSGSSGILSFPSSTPMSEQNIVARQALKDSVEKTVDKVEKTLKEYVDAQNLEKMVSIVKTDKGVSIRIMDSVLFDSGSSRLSPAAYPIIDKIISTVRDTPYYVNVEGHTDDAPAGGALVSNWDLSVSRAVAVLKYFIAEKFDPSRLSASGFGEYHPLLPNITAENRARNRRVEINIIAPEFVDKGANPF